MFFSLVKRLHLDGSYIRSWLILAIDLAVSATATLVAFLGIDYFVRNSGFSLLHYLFLLVSAFFCSAVAFYIFRTYRTVIRHSSLREVWKLGAATLLKELLMLFILWFWPDGMTFKAIGLCVVLDLFVTAISRWPVFLPTLFHLWEGHPDPSQNVPCDLTVVWKDGKPEYTAENGPVEI